MTLLRSWRSLGRLLIGVLISTQMAIAAHACPAASRMGMDEGGGMEPGLSSVCVARCHDSLRSPEQAQLTAMPAVLAGYLNALPPLGEFLESSGAFPGPGRPAPVAAGPPHAILHCCLRN